MISLLLAMAAPQALPVPAPTPSPTSSPVPNTTYGADAIGGVVRIVFTGVATRSCRSAFTARQSPSTRDWLQGYWAGRDESGGSAIGLKARGKALTATRRLCARHPTQRLGDAAWTAYMSLLPPE